MSEPKSDPIMISSGDESDEVIFLNDSPASPGPHLVSDSEDAKSIVRSIHDPQSRSSGGEKVEGKKQREDVKAIHRSIHEPQQQLLGGANTGNQQTEDVKALSQAVFGPHQHSYGGELTGQKTAGPFGSGAWEEDEEDGGGQNALGTSYLKGPGPSESAFGRGYPGNIGAHPSSHFGGNQNTSHVAPLAHMYGDPEVPSTQKAPVKRGFAALADRHPVPVHRNAKGFGRQPNAKRRAPSPRIRKHANNISATSARLPATARPQLPSASADRRPASQTPLTTHLPELNELLAMTPEQKRQNPQLADASDRLKRATTQAEHNATLHSTMRAYLPKGMTDMLLTANHAWNVRMEQARRVRNPANGRDSGVAPTSTPVMANKTPDVQNDLEAAPTELNAAGRPATSRKTISREMLTQMNANAEAQHSGDQEDDTQSEPATTKLPDTAREPIYHYYGTSRHWNRAEPGSELNERKHGPWPTMDEADAQAVKIQEDIFKEYSDSGANAERHGASLDANEDPPYRHEIKMRTEWDWMHVWGLTTARGINIEVKISRVIQNPTITKNATFDSTSAIVPRDESSLDVSEDMMRIPKNVYLVHKLNTASTNETSDNDFSANQESKTIGLFTTCEMANQCAVDATKEYIISANGSVDEQLETELDGQLASHNESGKFFERRLEIEDEDEKRVFKVWVEVGRVQGPRN